MEISKSSRHQKIIGNFGENLICNWLSRSDFEATIVDHTGIDIIAYNPSKDQRLGITVKSRTRKVEKERDAVNVFSSREKDRQTLKNACKAFACEPWIAVYTETSEFADIYLTSLDNYDKNYRNRNGQVSNQWRMREEDKKRYDGDSAIKHIHFSFSETNWFKK